MRHTSSTTAAYREATLMFVRSCGEPRPHKTHTYHKQWVQAQLERLGVGWTQPSGLASVWTVTYRCPGVLK